MKSLFLYVITYISLFNSISFCAQLTDLISQKNISSPILLLPKDILFTLVTDDQTRNVLQKTCHSMNQLFSIKKPSIELISHSLFHTNEKNARILAVSTFKLTTNKSTLDK